MPGRGLHTSPRRLSPRRLREARSVAENKLRRAEVKAETPQGVDHLIGLGNVPGGVQSTCNGGVWV